MQQRTFYINPIPFHLQLKPPHNHCANHILGALQVGSAIMPSPSLKIFCLIPHSQYWITLTCCLHFDVICNQSSSFGLTILFSTSLLAFIFKHTSFFYSYMFICMSLTSLGEFQQSSLKVGPNTSTHDKSTKRLIELT